MTFRIFDFSSRNLLECELFDFSTFRIFRIFRAEISWNLIFLTFRIFRTFRLFDFSNFSNFSTFRAEISWNVNFSTFRVKLFYHDWNFQRKVAFEPPKQYTKLGTQGFLQGFLSYHLSSTRRQARSRSCGSRKCLARNPQKGRIDLGWDG